MAHRGRLLAAGVLLAILAWFPARRLMYDRSVENMFAPDDPILNPYHKLQRTFGGNEVALAAYDDPELLTPQGIERLERLTAAVEQVPGVTTVLSLTRSPLGETIAGVADRRAARGISQGL